LLDADFGPALLDADFGPLGRNQHPARRGKILFYCHPDPRLRVKLGSNEFLRRVMPTPGWLKILRIVDFLSFIEVFLLLL